MTTRDICVDILMSTYNGEKYLAEQIESLIAQTHSNWRLVVRDDGSSDDTVGIVQSYINRYPNRIVCVDGGAQMTAKRLGAGFSFLSLLQNSEAEYVMFCDQDDVWLPSKIEITLHEMLRMEESYGKNTPILVHTDLQVVDETLKIISPSTYKYRKIDPSYNSLNRMLMQNTVTGCAAMFNLALKKKIKNVPKDVIIHDWWVALVAAAFGKISYINVALVYYRQHGCNVIGVKKWGLRYFIKRALFFLKFKEDYLSRQQQAKAFLEEYTDELSEAQREVVLTFAELSKNNFFKRKMLFVKNKYFMSGIIRNLFIILFC